MDVICLDAAERLLQMPAQQRRVTKWLACTLLMCAWLLLQIFSWVSA